MAIDWAELSKLVIAFLGGVITTYLGHLFTNSRDRRKLKREEQREKRILKIVSEIEYLSGPGSLPTALQFVVTAINDGFRPITIDKGGLILEDADGLKNQFGVSSDHEPWPSLPKTLKDGEAIKFYMDLGIAISFAKSIKNYTYSESGGWEITSVFVRDVEGNEYEEKIPASQRATIGKIISGEMSPRLDKSLE